LSGIQLTNLRELSSALKHVVAVTKKAEAEIVTKAAKDVAFRAASFSPKANQVRVVRSLKSDNLLPALASINCNKRYGRKQWNRQHHSDEMLRILMARRRGLGALRAGWIPAIQKLGGKYRGAKVFPGGTAARGTAKAATISELSAWILNSVQTKNHEGIAFGTGEIAASVNALNQAVQSVTSDRLQYAEKKLKEANRNAQ
jgi:hypothetical protein